MKNPTNNEINQLYAIRRLAYFVNDFYSMGHRIPRLVAAAERKAKTRIADGVAMANEILGKLGPNEQRAIYRGWLPTRISTFPEVTEFPLVPVLDFDAMTSDGMIITDDYAPQHRGNAVTLRIKEGATLPEVLAALDELNQQVPRWFHRCIADDEWQGAIEIGGKRGMEVLP